MAEDMEFVGWSLDARYYSSGGISGNPSLWVTWRSSLHNAAGINRNQSSGRAGHLADRAEADVQSVNLQATGSKRPDEPVLDFAASFRLSIPRLAASGERFR
jgi:hypothetical protein